MSVVVAVKENGIVYMGADTQSTAGKKKKNELNESNFKIRRMGNGILVGTCGEVSSSQLLFSERNLFTLDSDGKLTKRHIVKEIIPKIIEVLKKGNKLDKDDGTMELAFLIAYKDCLYEILSDFFVLNLAKFAARGAGSEFVLYSLSKENLPVRERILQALRISAKRIASVSAPYVLIDTEKQNYEVVEE